MVKSPHPTHIDLAPSSATAPARSPDDDVETAYDGPMSFSGAGAAATTRGAAAAGTDADADGDIAIDGNDTGPAALEYESDDAEGAIPSPERQAKLDKARAAGLLVPRGILKNAPGRLDARGREIPAGDHLTWDEGNLALTEIQKDSLMKIDEPKTPFVSSGQLGETGDVPDFELTGGASPALSSRGRDAPPSPGARSRSQDAALVAANTRHNAQLGAHEGARTASPTAPAGAAPSPLGDPLSPAPAAGAGTGAGRSRTPSQSGSRSASFSLPDVRGGHIVRRPSSGAGSLAGVGGDEVIEEDYGSDADEAIMDPETLQKHREFKQRRKGHYSNEAEAMRMAQALIAKEADEDE